MCDFIMVFAEDGCIINNSYVVSITYACYPAYDCIMVLFITRLLARYGAINPNKSAPLHQPLKQQAQEQVVPPRWYKWRSRPP